MALILAYNNQAGLIWLSLQCLLLAATETCGRLVVSDETSHVLSTRTEREKM